jgi:hypothetical protein
MYLHIVKYQKIHKKDTNTYIYGSIVICGIIWKTQLTKEEAVNKLAKSLGFEINDQVIVSSHILKIIPSPYSRPMAFTNMTIASREESVEV